MQQPIQGCGSGNLVLALSYLFPSVDFVALDMRPRALDVLRERAEEVGLTNLEIVVGRIESYDGPIDVAISLHACGSASDHAIAAAVDRGVPFAISPCCLGKVNLGAETGERMVRPRSRWLTDELEPLVIGSSGDDGSLSKMQELVSKMAQVADRSEVEIKRKRAKGGGGSDGSDDSGVAVRQRARAAKSLFEKDRLLWAEETNKQYTGRTWLVEMSGLAGYAKVGVSCNAKKSQLANLSGLLSRKLMYGHQPCAWPMYLPQCSTLKNPLSACLTPT
mmetsp:Transcript_14530/g.38353  ORF Transcript_14530/g.38353 Transcript_14530/m.38353 type:complete len:277 (+) Transcript_14530:597-1427(+)